MPASDRDAPIFVVGANRSGTTLLRLLLNAHSRIGIPEELIYLSSHMAGVPVEKWQQPPLSTAAYEAFVDQFLRNSRAALGDLDLEALREEILAGPRTFRTPYATALRAWARHHGKARWGEKTPGNLYYADVLREMFPRARFVHIVRDPRAGVHSMQGAPFFSDDLVFNALARRKDLTEGRARFERAIAPSHRITIRYEDLVRSPEGTLQAVCAFLGEAYEPAMLSFHEDASDYMKPSAASTFNAAATSPISAEQAEKWRRRMAPGDVALVEAVCDQQMRAFGYEPEHLALGLRARLDLWIKSAYWALQCYRNRGVRHYVVKHQLLARSRNRLRRARQQLRSRLAPSGS